MLLGKRVLGAEGAAIERAKTGGGGAMVVAGKRVMGHEAKPAVPEKKNVRTSGNRVAKTPAPKAAPAPAALSFTEAEVEAMLEQDPNRWDTIVDAESLRPDGPRPVVAALILAAADRATTKPIPGAIVEALEKLTAVKAKE